MSMETKDLLLGKAKPEDWESMYRNVWSRPAVARFMQWRITTSAADAQARMERTIAWQKNHDTYLVYEKSSGQAIGFAGVEEIVMVTPPPKNGDFNADVMAARSLWGKDTENRFYSSS